MKRWLVVIIILICQTRLYAQIDLSPDSKTPFGQRLYFGGSFSLQFGDITYIDASPLVGYIINQNLSAGIGITYRYLRYSQIDYHSNVYGGRLFVRRNISILRLPLFLYSEFEDLRMDVVTYNSNHTDYYLSREWIPSLFVGGGLFQPIGRRAGFTIMVLYNIIYNDLKSPYNSPLVLRVGFTL